MSKLQRRSPVREPQDKVARCGGCAQRAAVWHARTVEALERFGSAAQGDPIYGTGVQFGSFLRTAFLADYFVKYAFRTELRRVLNRHEAVSAFKRAR